jgi:hypothetical protein
MRDAATWHASRRFSGSRAIRQREEAMTRLMAVAVSAESLPPAQAHRAHAPLHKTSQAQSRCSRGRLLPPTALWPRRRFHAVPPLIRDSPALFQRAEAHTSNADKEYYDRGTRRVAGTAMRASARCQSRARRRTRDQAQRRDGHCPRSAAFHTCKQRSICNRTTSLAADTHIPVTRKEFASDVQYRRHVHISTYMDEIIYACARSTRIH